MKKIIVLLTVIFCITTYLFSSTLIEGVKFSSNSITVSYDGITPKYRIKTLNEPSRVVVDLYGSKAKTLQDIPVNSKLINKIKTSQFAEDIVRVVVTLFDSVTYKVFEKKNEIVLMFSELKNEVFNASFENLKVIMPSSDEKNNTGSNTKFSGIMDLLPDEKIDVEYVDADIRDVLKILASKAKINLIFDNEIRGTISVSLKNVPFKEAFKTILNIKNYVAQEVGDNILRISTAEKLLEEQKEAYLQTKIFFLNYVKASDLKEQIKAIAGAEGRSTSQVNVDETNNALIVTDTPLGLDKTEKLIKQLDRMPKQVLIEAKLVEVNLGSDLHAGINWTVSYTDGRNYVGANDPSAAIGPTSQWGGAKSITPGYTGSFTGTPANLPVDKGGAGVNLPAQVIYGAFRFGRVTSDFMFDAVISAAAKKGNAKVLSNPKIATLNNQEATINITNQIPYTTTEITNTSAGSVSSTKVTYVTTGITLTVTPTITPDGKILMKINPKVSQPSQTAQFEPPSVNERSAETTIVVNNGETVVIGGLIHDSESEYLYKVPILGDIPILGYLFKKKSKERNRMELLIFVTPKIIGG